MAAPDIARARLDRWLTLGVISPLRALVPGPKPAAMPILMYHSVGSGIQHAEHPYYGTVTTPATFTRHVKLLRAQGYQSLTLSAAVSMMREPGFDFSRKVVLTFDDGFRDFYTCAFPILEQAGFTATLFVATNYIGKRFLTGRQCLSRRELSDLCERGVEVGSHSLSHRRLVTLARHELIDEVSRSKSVIEDITGREVRTFSYPYRFPQENRAFVSELGELLRSSGYQAGVTTIVGRSVAGDDPRFLPRLPANDADDPRLLQAKLDGHYDWIGTAQWMHKYLRAFAGSWRGT